MTITATRIMTLGAALWLAPFALFGQSDPSAMPPAAGGGAQPGMPGANPNASNSNPSDSSSGMGAEAQTMKDKMFVRKAAEGGLAEVQLGQLAEQKSGNDAIKQFGAKMVADHTMLNGEMKPVADNLGVQTPKKMSKKDQDEYDQLAALSGTDFDKAYLTAMVKDHRKDLREFREEAESAGDSQLKDVVMKAEDVILDHLRTVSKLARENGVEIPRGPRPPAPQQ
jgi:putative membrane protein